MIFTRRYFDSAKAFLALVLCFFLIFSLQHFRVIEIKGVTPNLILLFFLFFPFLRLSFSLFLFCGALYLFFLFSSFPFWVIQGVIILFCVSFIYAILRFLTGNPFFDFFISFILSTSIFYLLLLFFSREGEYVSEVVTFISNFSIIVGIEIFMGLLLGEGALLLFRKR